jgi:hypothetical protein
MCKKKIEGIKCFDCSERETCPQLNPPKPNLRFDFPTSKEDKSFNPLPLDTMSKYLYRMLLLMSEDFMLTSAEKRELIFLASRFQPFSKKGGRGKSKERIFAYLCIYLLKRDGREIVFEKSKDFYTSRYNLDMLDSQKMKDFVESEVKRIFTIKKEDI